MKNIDKRVSYDYGDIVLNLLDWYSTNARVLPWRLDPTPYHVWVSEIMLQQTRVEAVLGYYERFLSVLPTIEDLANASEEVLLKLWEGLGYYSRVRNLNKAAKVIVDEYNGELPCSYQELLKLPGIGTYTAGAIASIAFGLPVAAVDGNVLRIAMRVAGSFDDITKASVKKQLEIDFTAITPVHAASAFNQSLMDLGATICIPNGKPLCDICPINQVCQAYIKKLQTQIPVKSKKKGRRIEERTVFVIESPEGKYVLHRRPNKGLLGGMWELPNVQGKFSYDLMQNYYNEAIIVLPLGDAKHIFSHVEWHMTGIHMVFTKSDLMIEFCGQMFSDQMRGVDNFGNIEENHKLNQNISEGNDYCELVENKEFELVTREELKDSFALPSAFEAFKIWK